MTYALYILLAWFVAGFAMMVFFFLWFRFGKRFKKDREMLRNQYNDKYLDQTIQHD